ncbi:MAG: hypothetical protein HY063_11675 [Bacteroidetes bacterium]|nr:hypothetical protein [Bacteroidota bacterium]
MNPLEKKPWTIKNFLKREFFVILAVIGIILIVQLFRGKSTSAIHEELLESANKLNKDCPITVNKDIRLDDCIAYPNNEMQWNYTLVNVQKGISNIDAIKKIYEPSIINQATSNPSYKIMRDNKVTLIYYYKDKDGKYLFDIKVTPEQYSK